MRKNKVIIDTDPGIDDAMALALAIKSTMLDILAVTTVCGNSTIENTTQNAMNILTLLGSSTIPVFAGAKKPLKRSLTKAIVHGENGLGGISFSNKLSPQRMDAVETIISLALAYPHEITLICLGPLTNVAKAMLKNPDAISLLKNIYIMGGAIKTAGNMNRVAEFNIYTDPEAAAIVFKFPLRKVLVPLDVCNQATLTLDDFKCIKNISLRSFFLKIGQVYKNNLKKDGVSSIVMYDPVTVYAYLFPKETTKIMMRIDVETKGDLTRGMTVSDLRDRQDEKPNMSVLININQEVFKNKFLQILNN